MVPGEIIGSPQIVEAHAICSSYLRYLSGCFVASKERFSFTIDRWPSVVSVTVCNVTVASTEQVAFIVAISETDLVLDQCEFPWIFFFGETCV